MKKFKLIKEYPGSPKLGAIAEKWHTPSRTYYRPKNPAVNAYLPSLNQKLVENQPEYWEEIVEKDYVILMWSDRNNSYSHSLRQVDENFVIRSVKRLSDGEVFTLGDNTTIGIITEIRLQDVFDNPIAVYGSNNRCALNFIYSAGKDKGKLMLQKVKEKLFTTKDGVDIFKGDTYYFVNSTTTEEFILGFMSNSNNLSDFYTRVETFYSKEKAIEYIVLNKPCMSVNDILNSDMTLSIQKNLWIKLAKEKLKL